jgi:putative transposase
MRYRRADTAGGTYCFTVNLAERNQTTLTDHVAVLRNIIAHVKRRHPFRIDAMAILPEHLHAIWTLPAGDADYPTRWALIKAGFSRHLPPTELRNRSRRTRGERGIWQRRYWEHLIRDEEDLVRHVDYIHYNPVKHRYVTQATQWPYSSIHRYIRTGMLLADWGAPTHEEDGGFGER